MTTGSEPRRKVVFCLACGNNMDSLAGDPIRCPKCGSLNNQAEFRSLEPLVKEELRRLETGPTLCAGGLICFLAGLAFLVFKTRLPACAAIFLIPGGVLFPTGFYIFGRACGFRPGWLGTICRYQLPLVGFMAVLLATMRFSPASDRSGPNRASQLIALILIVILITAVKGLSNSDFNSLYWMSKRRFDSFCRQIAIARVKAKNCRRNGLS